MSLTVELPTSDPSGVVGFRTAGFACQIIVSGSPERRSFYCLVKVRDDDLDNEQKSRFTF